ncbi:MULTISPECIES: serine protease [unclassified Bradyrhizobium]|uniref:serine protease n=1 Tax=unclassified Bradyrhizobium TaxID=2631580 RepID=UPI002915E086|nr:MULTISPECIES: serine protease [unclassified Bradyrhizobium]
MTSASDRKSFEDKRRNVLFTLDTPGTESQAAMSAARDLVREARGKTYYDELGIITDRIRFYDPQDIQNIVFSAQSLVNRGMPFAARDVLLAARTLVQEGDDSWYEIQGLLGRTAKQIFLDSPDRTSNRARQYLDDAIAAYRVAFEKEPTRAFWHGGNIAALLTISRSLGSVASPDTDPVTFSHRLKQVLDDVSKENDCWWHATYVEAELGAKNWQAAAERLKSFLDCASEPFFVESLLRQLTEVWALQGPQSPPMVSAMLGLLRAKLLIWTGTSPVQVSAAEITSGVPDTQIMQKSRDDLQKVFGDEAPRLIDWWVLGIDRAKSVAAICAPNELNRPVRMGTGFLVKLKDSNTDGEAGCFVLTNAHVVGDPSGAAIPSIDNASVRFEGYDPDKTFPIKEIVWTSPVSRHDATIVRIDGCPVDIKPIPMTRQLPDAGSANPLYVIGHSGGNELSFSFRDNRLLDHEGAPAGHPHQDGVVMVHYTTPTTNGSSGSPVFVERQWKAIALHHSGSAEMRRLNGKGGTYRANEGISLASISDALAADKELEFCF